MACWDQVRGSVWPVLSCQSFRGLKGRFEFTVDFYFIPVVFAKSFETSLAAPVLQGRPSK